MSKVFIITFYKKDFPIASCAIRPLVNSTSYNRYLHGPLKIDDPPNYFEKLD